jgi:hypothetical protein
MGTRIKPALLKRPIQKIILNIIHISSCLITHCVGYKPTCKRVLTAITINKVKARLMYLGCLVRTVSSLEERLMTGSGNENENELTHGYVDGSLVNDKIRVCIESSIQSKHLVKEKGST